MVMPDPSYSETDETVDRLVIELVNSRSVTLTDNQSQGALTRGAVLGRHTDGTFGRVHQTGNYGAATAKAVLLLPADPSGGDVTALVGDAGKFNQDELNFGGTVTVADVREPLSDRGVHLKDPVSTA